MLRVATRATACTLVLILVYIMWTLQGLIPPKDVLDRTTDTANLDNVLNATLGFQEINVLNLPYRTDRRDSMSLAASLSSLQIQYTDAIADASRVPLPPGGSETELNNGSINNWRTHLNAIRSIVERNVTTALILEDDVDWDVRIKSQMRNFARTSRLLLQPRFGSVDDFMDPSYPRPAPDQSVTNFDVDDVAPDVVSTPSTSPYGDIHRWDILWLGHCGCRFPAHGDRNVPIGRAILASDATVPQSVNPEFGTTELTEQYPPSTRVTSRAWQNTCLLGYAVTLGGARRILYELGVHKMDGTTDMEWRSLCHGVEGRLPATCLTVQPQLFQHHRPVGSRKSFSDIEDYMEGYNSLPSSENIQMGVKARFEDLLNNE